MLSEKMLGELDMSDAIASRQKRPLRLAERERTDREAAHVGSREVSFSVSLDDEVTGAVIGERFPQQLADRGLGVASGLKSMTTHLDNVFVSEHGDADSARAVGDDDRAATSRVHTS